MRVPDLKFINRSVPILEVARALDLRIASSGLIHCWRPERHQHCDRTASVGIREANNTVKCFGCDIGPLGPIDLVMAVLGLSGPGDAARWISARFDVPDLPPGRHLVQPERRIFQFGTESDFGFLVHSGLWAMLSPAARALAPVLLELCEYGPATQIRRIQISYIALGRYSGLSSPNAIAGALRELREIHWLSTIPGLRTPGSAPVRGCSTYLLTPKSDKLLELAQTNSSRMRENIEVQRKLRAEARAKRKRSAY